MGGGKGTIWGICVEVYGTRVCEEYGTRMCWEGESRDT
jgi:hypothetical protein